MPLYGVTDEAQVAQLMGLAREGKQQGWWQSYELDFATYVDLETGRHRAHLLPCPPFVPGILQTPEYARAMH